MKMSSLFLGFGLGLLSSNVQAQLAPNGTPGNIPVFGPTGQLMDSGRAPVAGVANVNGLVQLTSPVVQAKTYDGTIQFQMGYTPGASEYWSCQGGNTGIGGTCYATNGTAPPTGNVNGNFVTQNAGNFFFATGSGLAAEIADSGAISTSIPILTPGTATTNPQYGSTGNTSLDAPAGSTGYLTAGGLVMAAFKNVNSIVANGNYIQFSGSTGGVGINCVNGTGSGNVNCNIKAQSLASVVLMNVGANLATFAVSSANTAVDQFLFRDSSSTQPLLITGASANHSVGVGTAALAANATTGFLGMPTCAAAPTGTPTQTAGWGFQCYNPVTHNLNIYDPVAASWYHVALTVGAL